MFYKFNTFIGRIVPSTQAEAYNPQGLNALARGPSVIVFDSKMTKVAHDPPATVTARPAAAAAAGAGASGGLTQEGASAASGQGLRLGVVPSTPRYRKIMEMQNMFLKEDGKLVWQKLGRDRLSYLATLAVMTVGTMFSISILAKMSFPPKSED